MKHYTHLSFSDRRRLYTCLEMGLSMTEIAQRLSRHRSTLYRELKRNKEFEEYLPGLAQHHAEKRHHHMYGNKLQKDIALHEYVIRGLKKGWSPEQIAGRMKINKLNYYACHETIYRYIYAKKNKKLFYCLHYKKPKRFRKQARKPQRCRYGEIRLITQRPPDIQTRNRFGHWEGDTIEFSGTKEKVVTTLVERKSRMVYLIKNNSKHSQGVMDKIANKFVALPLPMFKTITFDQGGEFANHRYLEQHSACKVYYCETRSPWQKGSNENMNGRLRRYLPNTMEIDAVSQEYLDQLALHMNQLPRKCLGFKTPNELFIQQHKNDCRTWK